MFRNNLLVAFRNLVRNRFATALNIGGLAIGMAVAILIGLWVYDQVSFDRSFPNHTRIAAVLQNQELSGGIETWWWQARQLAPALRKDYGGQFKHVVTVYEPNKLTLGYGDNKMKLNGVYTDSGIIDMLSLDMIRGGANALNDPASIILSATQAKSLFGAMDPLGKVVKVESRQLLKVTGVYADFPANSSFANYGFIIPFDYLVHTDSNVARVKWGNSWFRTYVQLDDKAEMVHASRAIRGVKAQYDGPHFKPALFLHPLDRWHLYSDFKQGVVDGGRIQYVKLFSLIGIFVLLLACINFMNLSTARSEKRAKEVGIRKAIGSRRGQLIRQFFGESVLIALLSFVVAIGVAQLLLPFFNGLSDLKMHIPYGQPLFWLTGLGFVLFTGLLAGSYPALYLSSFRPVKVLKGAMRVGKLAALPRKALVVVQFSVSVILIIGTIVVLHQIQYVKDRPIGYNQNGLIMVPSSETIRLHYDVLRTELKQTGLVEEVTASMSSPVNTQMTNMGYDWRGKDPSLREEFTANGVMPGFGKVTGWQIVDGRDFSEDTKTDFAAYIINEAAAKYMGLKHPVGEMITRDNGNERYTIIGVVKDMVNQNPFEPVKQTIYFLNRDDTRQIDIRVKPQAGMRRALAAIGALFSKYDPDNTFEYSFADQEYAKNFSNEEHVGRLAGFFTALAILISCLGLLGLSAFVAEQRIREVGIRKVLGASVFSLWKLLSREFVGLVGLSLLIGGPVAYWIMHGWLNNYGYHAGLSWWIFASAALGAIGLTLLTVSFQAIRAAVANPVKSLRAE